MKRMLEEFAYGNILPNLAIVKKDSEYGRMERTMKKYEKKLSKKLEGESKKLLERLVDAQSEASIIAETDKFIYGYRLGVLMTMEVFNGYDDALFGKEDE